MDFDWTCTTVHQERRHLITIQGAAAADPVKTLGQSVTVKRTGVGTYNMTWTDYPPGTFVQFKRPAFRSVLMTDVAQYMGVCGTYSGSTLTLPITIVNAAGAATDLTSTQFCDFEVVFSELSTP